MRCPESQVRSKLQGKDIPQLCQMLLHDGARGRKTERQRQRADPGYTIEKSQGTLTRAVLGEGAWDRKLDSGVSRAS